MTSTTEPSGFGDEVALRLPAHADSLPVARTLAAAVASHWGFNLDTVDDARLTVSELLTHVFQNREGCLTHVGFTRDQGGLRITVRTDENLPAPSPESFGWLVISELASEVTVGYDANGLSITAVLTAPGSAG